MVRKLRPGIRVEEFIPIEDPDDQGTYETWWGRARVHAKIHDPAKPFMLANELIGTRLAAALGLPTLPGEIARSFDGRNCWVTPRISESGTTSPPPATEAQIAAEYPNVVAGMLAFDSWIHNVDRTADNVLFDPRLGVWLIDHENSLAEPDGRAFGRKADQVAETPLASHPFVAAPLGWINAGLPAADDDSALTLHRWIGTALPFLMLGAWWLKPHAEAAAAGRNGPLYAIALSVVAAAILAQAYLGAEVTHGAGHMAF